MDARFVALLAATTGTLGCHDDHPPLKHDAYVWQRAWTPAVVAAVRTNGPRFDALRVLAADGATIMPAPVGLTSAVAVLRVEGSQPVAAASVAPTLDAVRDRWHAAGVTLAGVEIDHDCATGKLVRYAATLRELRRHLDVPLTITALPTWIGARTLEDVLDAVDGVVLQVHAVDHPERGLFHPQRAQHAIRRFAQITDKPFYAALPAYGIESAAHGAVWAEPKEVASLLRALEHDRPRHLAGVVWFRLPVEGDRGAWAQRTLDVVRAGAVIATRFDVALRGVDVVLTNASAVDALAPVQVSVGNAGACALADGINGYVWDGERFTAHHPPRLHPGESIAVGWVRSEASDAR